MEKSFFTFFPFSFLDLFGLEKGNPEFKERHTNVGYIILRRLSVAASF